MEKERHERRGPKNTSSDNDGGLDKQVSGEHVLTDKPGNDQKGDQKRNDQKGNVSDGASGDRVI